MKKTILFAFAMTFMTFVSCENGTGKSTEVTTDSLTTDSITVAEDTLVEADTVAVTEFVDVE